MARTHEDPCLRPAGSWLSSSLQRRLSFKSAETPRSGRDVALNACVHACNVDPGWIKLCFLFISFSVAFGKHRRRTAPWQRRRCVCCCGCWAQSPTTAWRDARRPQNIPRDLSPLRDRHNQWLFTGPKWRFRTSSHKFEGKLLDFPTSSAFRLSGSHTFSHGLNGCGRLGQKLCIVLPTPLPAQPHCA